MPDDKPAEVPDIPRDPGHSHNQAEPCEPEHCTGHPIWDAIKAGHKFIQPQGQRYDDHLARRCVDCQYQLRDLFLPAIEPRYAGDQPVEHRPLPCPGIPDWHTAGVREGYERGWAMRDRDLATRLGFQYRQDAR